MFDNINNKFALGLSSLALLVLTGCMAGPPLRSDISDAIAHATTAADHQQIANYFYLQAARYDTEAAQHEKMANAYGGYPRGPISYISHCRSLQRGFSAAANDARALEQAHRQLAAGVGK